MNTIENNHGVTVRLTLDNMVKRKVGNIEGNTPLYYVGIGVHKKGERRQRTFSKGKPKVVEMTRERFKNVWTDSKYKGKTELAEFINVIGEYEKIIQSMPLFTWDLFRSRLKKHFAPKGEDGGRSDFEAYCHEKERLNNSQGKTFVYQSSYKSLVAFNKGLDVSFADITPEFLKKWDAWMLDEGYSLSTIANYAMLFRTAWNYASEFLPRLKESYPFGKYKYETRSTEVDDFYLNLDEVMKMKNAELVAVKDDPTTNLPKNPIVFRDIWLIVFYVGGINLHDLFSLKNSDIDKAKKTISFFRSKGKHKKRKEKVIVPVRGEAEELFKKYAQPGGKDDLVFPFYKGVKENRREQLRARFARELGLVTKAIAKDVGIERWKEVTYYTARHSYANYAASLGLPVSMISRILGHSSITMTERYIGKLSKDDLDTVGAIMERLG